jgi:hypothetical protein
VELTAESDPICSPVGPFRLILVFKMSASENTRTYIAVLPDMLSVRSMGVLCYLRPVKSIDPMFGNEVWVEFIVMGSSVRGHTCKIDFLLRGERKRLNGHESWPIDVVTTVLEVRQ